MKSESLVVIVVAYSNCESCPQVNLWRQWFWLFAPVYACTNESVGLRSHPETFNMFEACLFVFFLLDLLT